MSIEIAANAHTGFADASSYDTYRPSYPPYSVQNLLRNLNVLDVSGARILEIGAGTGKFTSLLAARGETYEIVALEPHLEMRQILERKALRGVKIVAGNATSMDGVEDDWADCVVVAQVMTWNEGYANAHSVGFSLVCGTAFGLPDAPYGVVIEIAKGLPMWLRSMKSTGSLLLAGVWDSFGTLRTVRTLNSNRPC